LSLLAEFDEGQRGVSAILTPPSTDELIPFIETEMEVVVAADRSRTSHLCGTCFGVGGQLLRLESNGFAANLALKFQPMSSNFRESTLATLTACRSEFVPSLTAALAKHSSPHLPSIRCLCWVECSAQRARQQTVAVKARVTNLPAKAQERKIKTNSAILSAGQL